MRAARTASWALLALSAGLAGAQVRPAPYAPQLAESREEMVRQLHRSYVCMFDSSRALMRMGRADREGVTLYAVGTCSAGAALALRRAGFSQDDSAEVIVRVADKAYDDALSWGTPPPPKRRP